MPGGGGVGAPAAARGGGVAVGGAGPMGEAMTGIGMSQQLDNMSNAGASSAGSRVRGAAHDLAPDTNDRTNAAMDNLGL